MKKTSPGDLASARIRHDVIIVGSGVAGLRAAIEAADRGLSVVLLAKDTARDSNTDVAQGGVAVALSDEDKVGLHREDTLAAGDGLCDEAAVSIMVNEGPGYITQLIDWGAQFDREGSRLAFTREGAHSANRILHAQGDATGRELLRALWHKAATLDLITFCPHAFSADLILHDGSCAGILVLDETSGRLHALTSGAVMLASGGFGQVYLETTNPPQATGDGLAIAWRAGAVVRDIEFVQFHPTALHLQGAPRFLLSEALRGEGGRLLTVDRRRLMDGVDARGDLAPRDIVARAIFNEITASATNHVLLDMTHRDAGWLQRRFPRIYSTCLSHGIDLAAAPVPVAPAAHYVMGGVASDTWGRTTLPGLYAAGEVACTGVHGANRLASNSLLEGLVFGARAGQRLAEDLDRQARPVVGSDLVARAPRCAPAHAREAVALVKSVAWKHLGIVRDAAGLRSAQSSLAGLLESMGGAGTELSRPGLEAGNMATVAALVARAALARTESRGAHFRADFQERNDPEFRRSRFLKLAGGRERAFLEPGKTVLRSRRPRIPSSR